MATTSNPISPFIGEPLTILQPANALGDLLHNPHDARLPAVALEDIEGYRQRGGYSDNEHGHGIHDASMILTESELLSRAGK